MSLFDKINSLGATVVVVTHDLELVHQFDHRIVTIENGRILSDIPAKNAGELIRKEEPAAAEKNVSLAHTDEAPEADEAEVTENAAKEGEEA